MYLKGLVYCLSDNSIFDIYCVVSTAHCRSDQQGMVLINLLSRTINFVPPLAACYSQIGKTMNTKNISGMLFCCKKKTNQA